MSWAISGQVGADSPADDVPTIVDYSEQDREGTVSGRRAASGPSCTTSTEVVLPATDYRDRKVKPDNAIEFDQLIGRAAAGHTMPFAESDRGAYLAASEHLLAAVDTLVAVWDGGPSGGYGGTADVVEAATTRRIPFTVIWPVGAARD
jgi:hypothetical protein